MSDSASHEFTDAALQSLASRLGSELAASGLTLATAESCTGGWIAKTFTDVAGSSAWFNGGVVSYSNDAKCSLLGVQQGTLKSHGAVSEAVVREMAQGALDVLGVDCAVSVSGVAGPGGGTPAKPVGLVWVAAAVRVNKESHQVENVSVGGSHATAFAQCIAKECRLDGSREDVRRAAVAEAIELVLQALELA